MRSFVLDDSLLPFTFLFTCLKRLLLCSFFRAITFLNHTVPDFTDNGASNIIKYGDDYYATSETNYIRKIDPVTLETQDKVTSSVDLERSHTSKLRVYFSAQEFLNFHTGGLHEVPAGELGFVSSTL